MSTSKQSFVAGVGVLALIVGTGTSVTSQSRASEPVRTVIDADRDGVADRRDPCPSTPARGRAVTEGCSALDLVANPGAVLDPALKELASISAALDTRTFPELIEVEEMLSAGRAEFNAAGELLRQGDMCQAAATGRQTVMALEPARDRVTELVPVLQTRTREEASRSPGVEYGDAGPRDIAWSKLRAADSIARAALTRLDTTVQVLDAACTAVVGSLAIKGRVVETDDANRRVRFGDGRAVGVPGTQTFDIARNSPLGVTGVAFADGTGVATSLVDGPVSKAALMLPCMALLVAPLQAAFVTAPASSYTLHSIKGYLHDGYLRLEAGTKLSVREVSCPTSSPAPGGFWQYSMKIVASYKKTSTGPILQEVIASDIVDGEVVSFPTQVALGTVVKLATTIRRQHCIAFANGNQCGVIEKMSGPSYKAKLSARRSFCSARGAGAVALDDDPATLDYRQHQISVVETSGIPSPFFMFEAEGYAVTNGASSRPQLMPITLKQHYAVYDDDFLDPDDLFSSELNGVDVRAAIRWPRIKGMHDGEPFWYTCEVQNIIRDAVELCPQKPHAFYKLPWSGLAKTTQGNNETLTHFGLQAFAFDFVMTKYDPIYAARGGTVTLVTEDLYKNSNPNLVKQGKQQWEPANAIQIRHQDGTYSWYFHMIQNTVFPEVGDVVRRGDLLAAVGKTGNATVPHLHYEVGQTEGTQDQTVQIRFQAQIWLGVSIPQWAPCHIPLKGQYLISTQ